MRHIVALRGDPVGGVGAAFTPHPQGYQTSTELVAGIRKLGDFEVTVSAYPEKHPESSSIKDDLDVLKAKIDAGATRAITQFFFDNAHYFRYVDRVRARGIFIPIIPGVVPVQSAGTAVTHGPMSRVVPASIVRVASRHARSAGTITLIVTTAGDDTEVPSSTVKVKASDPVKPGSGV